MSAHFPPGIDRCSERVHIFLVAALYVGAAGRPVRVRNMSTSGALVEGAALPTAGTAIILRRGALEAPGTVAWSEEGRAGVAFAGLVDVSEWLPAKERKRQSKADQIAFGLKHAMQKVAPVVAPPFERATPALAVLAELAEVQAQLGRLGDQLAEDAFVLTHHPEVQNLDAATQRIGRIIEALRTISPTCP